MADSFQKEIPKARINITLDVEVGGAKRKKELPLKMLIMGDFTRGKTKCPIAMRERININKTNFDQVISDMVPELISHVPNTLTKDGTQLNVRLIFKRHQDFHPEHVITQIPELNRLLGMRNLLKDLKANILDNNEFRRELERIFNEQDALQGLHSELKQVAPLEMSD